MKTYLRLLRYLRPYTGRLAVALACMALFAATNFVSLGMISPLMSVLFRSARRRAGRDRAGGRARRGAGRAGRAAAAGGRANWASAGSCGRSRWWRSSASACILLVIFLLKNLADYLQAFLMVSIEQGVIRDLRSALYAHLQELSLSFFHGRRSGMLVSRVTNDMEYLRAALASSISNLVKHGLTLLGALTWVFVTSWQLALLSLLVVPPLGADAGGGGPEDAQALGAGAGAHGRHDRHPAGVDRRRAGGQGVRHGGFERARFDRANQGFYAAFVHLRRVSAAAQPLTELAIVVVAVAMLWVGGRQIFVHHGLAPQSFMLFVGALLTMLSPIKSLAEVNANVQQGVAAAQRVFGLLDTAAGDRGPAGGGRAAGAVGPRSATRTSPSPTSRSGRCWRTISLRAAPRRGGGAGRLERGGQEHGDGPAGALLRAHRRGASPWTAWTCATARSPRCARQLGIVTQETILFHDTVRANIAYGLQGAADEAVRAAAARGPRRRVHRAPAAGLRHGDRRARR